MDVIEKFVNGLSDEDFDYLNRNREFSQELLDEHHLRNRADRGDRRAQQQIAKIDEDRRREAIAEHKAILNQRNPLSFGRIPSAPQPGLSWNQSASSPSRDPSLNWEGVGNPKPQVPALSSQTPSRDPRMLNRPTSNQGLRVQQSSSRDPRMFNPQNLRVGPQTQATMPMASPLRDPSLNWEAASREYSYGDMSDYDLEDSMSESPFLKKPDRRTGYGFDGPIAQQPQNSEPSGYHHGTGYGPNQWTLRLENWPVDKYPGEVKRSSPYGMRDIGEGRKMHKGMDFAVSEGTPVKAARSGKIVFAGYNADFGNVVVIEHPDKYYTTYAHLSKILVEVGEEVDAGKKIGESGHSGHTDRNIEKNGKKTGDHLHMEITQGGYLNKKIPHIDPELIYYLDD